MAPTFKFKTHVKLSDLEEQPFQTGDALSRIGREELPRLLREVQQDGAGLEDGLGLAVGGVVVDDRRDLGVGGYLRNTADNDDCQ